MAITFETLALRKRVAVINYKDQLGEGSFLERTETQSLWKLIALGSSLKALIEGCQ